MLNLSGVSAKNDKLLKYIYVISMLNLLRVDRSNQVIHFPNRA